MHSFIQSKQLSKAIPKFNGHYRPVTEKRLQEALKVSALLVKYHGEKYLPIFLRIEKELVKHQRSRLALVRAKDFQSHKISFTLSPHKEQSFSE